mgnify:CR=1 FL=1
MYLNCLTPFGAAVVVEYNGLIFSDAGASSTKKNTILPKQKAAELEIASHRWPWIFSFSPPLLYMTTTIRTVYRPSHPIETSFINILPWLLLIFQFKDVVISPIWLPLTNTIRFGLEQCNHSWFVRQFHSKLTHWVTSMIFPFGPTTHMETSTFFEVVFPDPREEERSRFYKLKRTEDKKNASSPNSVYFHSGFSKSNAC